MGAFQSSASILSQNGYMFPIKGCSECCKSEGKEEVVFCSLVDPEISECSGPVNNTKDAAVAAMQASASSKQATARINPSNARFFPITLKKQLDQPLGIDVDWGDRDRLRMTRIKQGLMSSWNDANPSATVEAGDYIVEANGIRGDAKGIFDTIKASSEMNLLICHVEIEPGE